MPHFPTDTAEAEVLYQIQQRVYHTPGVASGARLLSHFGEHALGWFGISALGMLLDRKKRNLWCKMGVAAFLSHAASVVIKRVVRRPRPHDERLEIGVSTPSKLSFPSSHATSTTASLAAIAFILGKGWPLAGIPVMMGSRLVLGVHYPTDVTAGAVVGASVAHLVMRSGNKKA